MEQLNYTPPLSLEPFVFSDNFMNFVVGPVGSTKTTGGIMKIAYHAKRMAACTDGIRRSRYVWVRNTREQLRDTSIPDFLKWYKPGIAGDFFKTEYRFILRFDDVESEILFRGLDGPEDVRRLLSLQVSGFIFEEFREIKQEIFEAAQGRVGRYPDKLLVPPREQWGVDEKGDPIGGCVTDDGSHNKRIWGMSNPPDMETFWEDFLTNPPKTASVFFQPSGLSPEADWVKWLPTNYYEDLAEGKSEEWINVYIHAKFGQSLSGKAVHPGFKADFHVSKTPLRPLNLDNCPLVIGMDFGLTPAAVIGQIYPQNRAVILAELFSDNTGALKFVREKLKPLLATQFPGLKTLVVGDPAGQQRAQTDERTVFDILRGEGFHAVPAAPTNALAARIGAVDDFLGRAPDGKAAFLLDPSIVHLKKALMGGYRYKIKTNGEQDDQPEKNKYSHIADALQYFCLHGGGGYGKAVVAKRREIAPVSLRGWT